MFKRTLLAAIAAFGAGVGLMYIVALQTEATVAGNAPDSVALVAVELPPAVAPQQDTQQEQQKKQIAEERRSVIVEAVQRVAPSVASVQITGIQRLSLFDDPFVRDFFGARFGPSTRRRVEVQSGSAVMISERGEFLTNEHVVAGAETISLLLPSGEERIAEFVGSSPELDLALLRIDPTGLRPVVLGTSSDLFVGEWLVAVGFPVGGRGITTESRYQPTVTVGVVSAVNRSFAPSERLYYADMIQTDAAINPGNSGGPIANAAGEVVGINTFILSESGGSQGLGFAIPIDRALRAVDEFRAYGRVRRVDPGNWRVTPVDSEIARYLDLNNEHGLLIRSVAGPAAEAGLRPDDVVLSVDGEPVDTIDDVRLALLPRFAGERVTLGVVRNGRLTRITFVLEEAAGMPG